MIILHTGIKINGYTVIFSAIFTKGNIVYDFLFASSADEILSKAIHSWKKEFAPPGANSFF